MKHIPKITEAEWQVMQVVWRLSPCLADEIIHRLVTVNRWKPATIKTFINRLLRKRLLRYTKQGKAYLYSPAHTEEECRRAEVDSFLQRVFGGDSLEMVSWILKTKGLYGVDRASFQKVIEQMKKV